MMLIHLLAPALYGAVFFLFFRDWPLTAYFTIGVYIGFALFFLDRIFHVFFTDPDHEFSQLVRAEWRQRRFARFFQTLITGRELQEKLVTRSILFLVAYLAITLYVLTSTGSLIGVGIVLGIGLHFAVDFLRYRRDLSTFHRHFLWQVKRKFTQQEVDALIASTWLLFLLLSLVVLIRR